MPKKFHQIKHGNGFPAVMMLKESPKTPKQPGILVPP